MLQIECGQFLHLRLMLYHLMNGMIVGRRAEYERTLVNHCNRSVIVLILTDQRNLVPSLDNSSLEAGCLGPGARRSC